MYNYNYNFNNMTMILNINIKWEYPKEGFSKLKNLNEITQLIILKESLSMDTML